MTVDRFLGCAESAVLDLGKPIKLQYLCNHGSYMSNLRRIYPRNCRRALAEWLTSRYMIHRVRSKCAHFQSHMIYDVELTQHNQQIAQFSPDTFPFRWGLGKRLLLPRVVLKLSFKARKYISRGSSVYGFIFVNFNASWNCVGQRRVSRV